MEENQKQPQDNEKNKLIIENNNIIQEKKDINEIKEKEGEIKENEKNKKIENDKIKETNNKIKENEGETKEKEKDKDKVKIIDNINETKENENKEKQNDLLEKIKKSPFILTNYILYFFYNSDNLNLNIFEKNIKAVKQKIYSIIKNKKENQDLYIILSTIYGAFLGDSMGSFCEFRTFNKENHLLIFNNNSSNIFMPGQVTDDSEMAMSLAYAIMDNGNYNSLNQHMIFYYYLIWYYSRPLDMGFTTSTALSTLQYSENVNITQNIFSEEIKQYISIQNSKSLANGLLMRISPLLCWFYMINKNYIKNILESKTSKKYYELYYKIYIEVEKDSQITHPNRENAVAGAILIFMGICAMEQKYSGLDILKMTNILFEDNKFNLSKEENILKNHFINIIQDYTKEGFNEDNYFKSVNNSIGYYLHAFKLTLYYLYRLDDMKKNMNIKEIYNKIIFSICDFGGDTDTNAAIVGMILGPLIGLENFDDKYLDIFLSFYSRHRVIYTNVFMYFYAKYLINISNNPPKTNDSKVNFNFYKILDVMMNKEI